MLEQQDGAAGEGDRPRDRRAERGVERKGDRLADEMQHAVAIVLVIAGGLVAVAVAVARAGSVVALERFRLLVGASDAADRAEGRHEALVGGVFDQLVPAFGDVATIDVVRGGVQRRIGARTGPGVDPRVAGAMTRRRSLEDTHEWLRQCPRVHLKLIVVDGTELYLGSANFTGAGMGAKGDSRRNFELGVTTSDHVLVDAAQRRFDRIWSGRECKGCRVRDKCPAPLDGQ